ncbi:class I SAM-dependent DNA methyltransferase [Candidatus Entotheonella palauensis]|uniref:Methyltransferase type 11 domain-containing protein n=1 Tax=Candidatus Entotheonella gemina TaxID=1429439 RepID=W4LZU5_9BACT|nr:class I SAM-dependent methyltransferase [Candidatus Entotheonella palauensis]ETX03445.1 MAG: hypothetical protein ETSY2_33490 [Candidatus Entotheonella gemina]
MSSEQTPQDHGWLTQASTDSGEVAKYYDEWATDYNDTLVSWNYRAPADTANLLKQYVPIDHRILDAGCGTGLSGQALHDAGYRDIVGIDISPDSLVIAEKTNVYRQVQTQDLQQTPFPFETDSFDALACVGVMTYVAEPAPVFREYCRLVSSGGYLVFTQRTDLFDAQDYNAVMAQLQDEGLWEIVSVSEPQPYLPNNEDYGDRILVIYIVARVK